MTGRGLRTILALAFLGAILLAATGCGGGADAGGSGADGRVEPPPGGDQPPAAPVDGVLFDGNFGSGDTSRWTEAQEVGEGASIEVLGEDPPPGFERFGRFRLGDGDERAEVYRDLELREGDDVRVRFLVRFGEGFPAEDTWQLFWQLHHADDDGSPPLALTVAGTEPGRFLLEGSEPDDIYWRGPEVETGRWHEFVVRVKHSSDPAVGFVELWHDGEPQTLANSDRRAHTVTLIDEFNYPKAGYYRNPEMRGEGVVDIAGYRISR